MADGETKDVVVCRSCISECDNYKSLYKHGIILGEVQTLGAMLNFCTDLEFTPAEHHLPNYICIQCVNTLAKSYAFKKMVLEADEMLRKQQAEVIGELVEESAVEETEEVEVQQHYEIESEELQELATAAQMRRTMDAGYITLTVLQESADEEEQIFEEHNQEVHEEEGEGEVDDTVVVHEVSETTEVYSTENEGEEDFPEEQTQEEAEYYEMSSIHEEEQVHSEVDVTEHMGRDSRKRTYSEEIDAKIMMPVKTRRKNTEPKPLNPELQCKVCGKQLSNPNSFKYHMQLHSDKTPFLCSLCGEGFKTRNAYEGHLVIHNPNNPNTCDLCGKSYRQSSSLRTHMLVHTGEKPFVCDICGKSMTQKSGYKKHMLVHTGEKPHTCDVCGRDFRYSSNLNAHKRCHSGEKPYECPHCEKCFPTSEQMKRHVVTHTGERPFSCDMCDKTFKRRSSMIAHRHLHESSTHELKQVTFVDKKVCKSNVVELY